jgi:hypothetical protein
MSLWCPSIKEIFFKSAVAPPKYFKVILGIININVVILLNFIEYKVEIILELWQLVILIVRSIKDITILWYLCDLIMYNCYINI